MKKFLQIAVLVLGAAVVVGLGSCTTEADDSMANIVKLSALSGSKGSSDNDSMGVSLDVSVPHENGYTGTKSNTKVTVTANVTNAKKVSRVVWKKGETFDAEALLADTTAAAAAATSNNSKWTFDITATDETANDVYSVAAVDEAGRIGMKHIMISQFDFTGPEKVKITNVVNENSSIIFDWSEPTDEDFDHVEIAYFSYDGTGGIEASTALKLEKGTTNKAFSGIDSSKAYYRYALVSVDILGNKSAAFTYFLSLNAVMNPESLISVTGATVSGAVSDSQVFIEGRTVTIGNLLVCDHEVTQKEYETYCKYGSSSPSSSFGVGDNYPAYFVNWNDAIVYCNLRSMAEGFTPVYKMGTETDPASWVGIVSDNGKYCGPDSENTAWDNITFDTEANGYRLPTEAEWEYVARGGNNGIPEPQTTYSGSNDIDSVAWYFDLGGFDYDYKVHEVKLKSANTLGIYDMTGNVYEWCYDTIALSAYGYVARGGFFCAHDYACTLSYRDWEGPMGTRAESKGFRVVRNAS